MCVYDGNVGIIEAERFGYQITYYDELVYDGSRVRTEAGSFCQRCSSGFYVNGGYEILETFGSLVYLLRRSRIEFGNRNLNSRNSGTALKSDAGVYIDFGPCPPPSNPRASRLPHRARCRRGATL